MITAIPLNLIFYFLCTVLGIWLMTRQDKNIKYICKLLACFIFVFLALWASQDVFFDVLIIYVNSYNSTTGVFTYTTTTYEGTSPIPPLFFEMLNAALAVLCGVLIYTNAMSE